MDLIAANNDIWGDKFGGNKNLAELPCKVSTPHTNILQAVHVAASIAMLEAVVVILVAASCLSADIKPDIWILLLLITILNYIVGLTIYSFTASEAYNQSY